MQGARPTDIPGRAMVLLPRGVPRDAGDVGAGDAEFAEFAMPVLLQLANHRPVAPPAANSFPEHAISLRFAAEARSLHPPADRLAEPLGKPDDPSALVTAEADVPEETVGEVCDGTLCSPPPAGGCEALGDGAKSSAIHLSCSFVLGGDRRRRDAAGDGPRMRGVYSTTRFIRMGTGWVALWKFGEDAITSRWISANSASVASPLTRTV